MSDTILKVNNLHAEFTCRKNKVNALRGVDFELRRGRTLAIVGESGSGKSVTVKTMLGIRCRNEKVSGEILYELDKDGSEEVIELVGLKKKEIVKRICGKQIAMVFQDPMTSLNPTMTIGKQIAEAVRNNSNAGRREAMEKARELLVEVGITNAELRLSQYPHQLSGGMRQRVVIAIALACNPKILICDEPTTALDVTIQAKILELIKSIQRSRRLTVIYITHDLGVVAKVADDVAVMYAGRIIEYGTAEDIFHNPRHPYTRSLLRSVPDINGRVERLYSIPGVPPILTEEIKGDAFAPRNPEALAIDYVEEPPKFTLSPTHFVYSWAEDTRAKAALAS